MSNLAFGALLMGGLGVCFWSCPVIWAVTELAWHGEEGIGAREAKAILWSAAVYFTLCMIFLAIGAP